MKVELIYVENYIDFNFKDYMGEIMLIFKVKNIILIIGSGWIDLFGKH